MALNTSICLIRIDTLFSLAVITNSRYGKTKLFTGVNGYCDIFLFSVVTCHWAIARTCLAVALGLVLRLSKAINLKREFIDGHRKAPIDIKELQ